MHRDLIDAPLAARLVAGQFPGWAGLPVVPVPVGGWDNRTFRLGDTMTVRLPTAQAYVPAVHKEQTWLPRLAPHLPVPVPEPLAMGAPTAEFPWPWSIRRWIDGRPATPGRIGAPVAFARDLAAALGSLQGVDTAGGPAAGAHCFHRGTPPAVYDAEIRAARDTLGNRIDAAGATAVWEAALAAPATGAPVWFHGDVASGNLLVDDDGRVAALLDFGTCGVGDPACDLTVAWTLFDERSRAAFRSAMSDLPGTDAAMWARGRGWALWKALITAAAPEAEPSVAAEALAVADLVVAEHRDAPQS